MSNVVGTIKIGEDRIITTKNNSIDTWTRFGNGDDSKFIIYNGNRYRLLKSKETEVSEVEDDEIDD
jgi:hypothetical protein